MVSRTLNNTTAVWLAQQDCDKQVFACPERFYQFHVTPVNQWENHEKKMGKEPAVSKHKQKHSPLLLF